MEESSYYENDPFLAIERSLKNRIGQLENDMQFITNDELRVFGEQLLLQRRADLIDLYLKYSITPPEEKDGMVKNGS